MHLKLIISIRDLAMEDSCFNLNLDGKLVTMDGNIIVRTLLNKLDIVYEDVLVIDINKNRLLTPDNRILSGDNIEIRTVYSKG